MQLRSSVQPVTASNMRTEAMVFRAYGMTQTRMKSANDTPPPRDFRKTTPPQKARKSPTQNDYFRVAQEAHQANYFALCSPQQSRSQSRTSHSVCREACCRSRTPGIARDSPLRQRVCYESRPGQRSTDMVNPKDGGQFQTAVLVPLGDRAAFGGGSQVVYNSMDVTHSSFNPGRLQDVICRYGFIESFQE